jgi:hypothetical protein
VPKASRGLQKFGSPFVVRTSAAMAGHAFSDGLEKADETDSSCMSSTQLAESSRQVIESIQAVSSARSNPESQTRATDGASQSSIH